MKKPFETEMDDTRQAVGQIVGLCTTIALHQEFGVGKTRLERIILITVIAISSLSTYLYCEYLVFGKKFGFALDVLTVASWQILIPLGVMGIWQLMSTIRIYVVVAAVLFSIVLDLVSDRKEAAR